MEGEVDDWVGEVDDWVGEVDDWVGEVDDWVGGSVFFVNILFPGPEKFAACKTETNCILHLDLEKTMKRKLFVGFCLACLKSISKTYCTNTTITSWPPRLSLVKKNEAWESVRCTAMDFRYGETGRWIQDL